MKTKAQGKEAWIIGITMGSCLTAALSIVFFVLATFQLSMPGMGGMRNDTQTVVPILAGAFIGVTLLGSLGAYYGGKLAGKAVEETK
jgi:hypothetical protein